MKCDYEDYSKVFKALSDETRLRIVNMLTESQELCACKILEGFNITQPTLSYHMRILIDTGLVVGTKNGAWMHYRLRTERLSDIRTFLEFKK
ncbi:MAG: metalloregulator ArsR/SmtB family transcription factor [Clostridium sp.]